MERAAAEHEVRGFRRRLVDMAEVGVAVIAELKKASPSKGLIRAEFDAGALAAELAAAGAGALSVLTDEEYFQGSLENLRRASGACGIPCLRKDFIVDEFQILEARAFGADAVLLIVAGLSDAELHSLSGAARGMGLDVLCEVHDEAELKRALEAGFETVGVNNRNLKTFVVDLETSLQLAELMPAGVLRVAESGIESGADGGGWRAGGCGGFRVGEQRRGGKRRGEEWRRLVGGAGG